MQNALLLAEDSQKTKVFESKAPSAATADRIVAALRKYPLITAVMAAAAAVVGTRSLLPWVTRALTLYALLKRI